MPKIVITVRVTTPVHGCASYSRVFIATSTGCDLNAPADLAGDKTFVKANLANMQKVEGVLHGAQGIVHLGSFSVEGPWEAILRPNIVGCYNLLEAARRKGVERIVFASSNRIVGFYPRQSRIGVGVSVRPVPATA